MDQHIYIVTGGTSFVASGLIRNLLCKNYIVYAICREDSLNTNRLPEHDNLKIIFCDLSELKKLTRLIQEKCDVFYHLGWSTAEKNDMYLQNENVKYTLDAVNVAAKLGCHTFIGTGSQAEYGISNVDLEETTPTFPVTGYGMAKLCAGQMSRWLCSENKIKHVWTRILSVYGPEDSPNTLIMYLIRCLNEGTEPELTHCEQIWDYIHIDDCAEVLYQLSTDYSVDGRTYVVGSGEARPLKEYVEIIRAIVNPMIDVKYGMCEKGMNTPNYLKSKERFAGIEHIGMCFKKGVSEVRNTMLMEETK